MRPHGTHDIRRDELEALVTRDTMIGTGVVKVRQAVTNGIHDLGGMHGFGQVVAEPNEPVFHADWERRVFELTLATMAWRLGHFRAVREQMPAAEYLPTTQVRARAVRAAGTAREERSGRTR
jgi:hypothetical protein